jgi:hypothetical protein
VAHLDREGRWIIVRAEASPFTVFGYASQTASTLRRGRFERVMTRFLSRPDHSCLAAMQRTVFRTRPLYFGGAALRWTPILKHTVMRSARGVQ